MQILNHKPRETHWLTVPSTASSQSCRTNAPGRLLHCRRNDLVVRAMRVVGQPARWRS